MDKKEWIRRQMGSALEKDPTKIKTASELASTLSKIYDLVDDVCASDDEAIQMAMRGANDALASLDAVKDGFSVSATKQGELIKVEVSLPHGPYANATVSKHGSKYETAHDIVSEAVRNFRGRK